MNKEKFHKILSLFASFLLCVQLLMVSLHQLHHKKKSQDLDHSLCPLCIIFHTQDHITLIPLMAYPEKVFIKEIDEEIVFVQKKGHDRLQRETISLRGPPYFI